MPLLGDNNASFVTTQNLEEDGQAFHATDAGKDGEDPLAPDWDIDWEHGQFVALYIQKWSPSISREYDTENLV